jgi:hypothetical protein
MKKKYQGVLLLATILSINVKCNSAQKEKEFKTTFIDSAYADSVMRSTDPVLNNKVHYDTVSVLSH